MSKETSGGYCGGVPPLPIPNREVKPTYADGTAMQCGRVGGRLLLEARVLGIEISSALFCIISFTEIGVITFICSTLRDFLFGLPDVDTVEDLEYSPLMITIL